MSKHAGAVVVEAMSPPPDPAACCERLVGLPYRLFLDSAAPGPRVGRYSFLTADPVAVVRSKGARTEVLTTVDGAVRVSPGGAIDAVRDLLGPQAAEPVDGLPPFQGGAAGYFAYDWGATFERVPSPRYDDLALHDVVLAIYDWVLAWDHEQQSAWLISTGLPDTTLARRAARARQRADAVLDRLRSDVRLESTAAAGRERPSAFAEATADRRSAERGGWSGPSDIGGAAPSYPVEGGWWDDRLQIRSSFTHAAYLRAVERVHDYIVAGDIFQANLSQRFEAAMHEPAWALYRRLRARNAAPFAAFVDFPEATVVSASPERFLQVDVGGRVETRPIKGTRPRGWGPEHDGALGLALTESEKDRAENLMIVDLMRNDLSRVCVPGTVRVSELFALERYATVHHLVSTVVGTLAPGEDALDLLGASFPGGSITGAPKVRAMEIIAELEPSARGVYCGSIGYWSVTGALDTSIAIRTAVARGGRVYFSAGGGIVADSEPEQEYRETLDKARGIIDTLWSS